MAILVREKISENHERSISDSVTSPVIRDLVLHYSSVGQLGDEHRDGALAIVEDLSHHAFRTILHATLGHASRIIKFNEGVFRLAFLRW